MLYDGEQELMEGVAVECVGKLVDEGCVLNRCASEYIGSLAQSVGRDTRLDANGRPGLMQRAVEPEAGFVLEDEHPAAVGDFFLIAGSLTSSHCR